jgi:hypothetical protein
MARRQAHTVEDVPRKGKKDRDRALEPVARASSTPPSPCDPPKERVRTTGIVFVHGIGTQANRETLLDWSRPIIDVLTAWRREFDERVPCDNPIGENPVGSASVASSADSYIEIDVPAFAGRERELWLLTEAYWASDVRAPSFSAAAGYIRSHLVGIVFGIARGYGLREARRMARLRDLLAKYADSPEPRIQQRVAELERSLQRRWALVDGLDRVVQFWFVRFGLAIVASFAALVALAIYAPLRAIPIDAIRQKAENATLDTFIVNWFGDLSIILDDPAQLAAIRTRLRERVCWLVEQGCTDVILVAHSGGTIVSYETLLRYTQAEFPVTKLVTLGEAIKLGWRLEAEAGNWVPGNPLRGNLKTNRPNLRWVDVWASYDPAPSGEMAEVPGSPLIAVARLTDLPDDPRIHVESRPVTNLMNLAQDHGGYWTNDEGFLIPLIRHLDDPSGDGSEARFYRDDLDRTVRTERRRRRVSLLLAWRWAAFLTVPIALAVAVVRGVDFRGAGDALAAVWGLLPLHELVSGPIDGVGHAVAVVLAAVGWSDVAVWLAGVGPVLLGLAIPIIAVIAIFLRGTGSWTAHDELERAAIRRERFGPPGSPSARSEGILLVGGLGAVILAAATPMVPAMLVYLGIVAVVAAVARAA